MTIGRGLYGERLLFDPLKHDGFSLAVDGTYVYWSDYQTGTVDEFPVGGGPVTTLVSGRSPGALAVGP